MRLDSLKKGYQVIIFKLSDEAYLSHLCSEPQQSDIEPPCFSQ
jgi:hypothetical protein